MACSSLGLRNTSEWTLSVDCDFLCELMFQWNISWHYTVYASIQPRH